MRFFEIISSKSIFKVEVISDLKPFDSSLNSILFIVENNSSLSGKILIDGTVPLVPPKVMRVQLPEEGCAAIRAQTLLGGSVQVISAFQNISAELLQTDAEIDCDVLVCGNDPAAREVVVQLAADAGMKAWHAGVIANSIVAEAMTSTLIFMNNRYKIDGAGLKITGTPGSAS